MAERKVFSDSPSWLARSLWKLALVFLLLVAVYLVYCDARVRAAFDARLWQQPAKVYARPMILRAGAVLDAQDLRSELQDLGYRVDANLSRPGSYFPIAGGMEIYLRGFDFAEGARPPERVQLRFGRSWIEAVSDANGRRVAEVMLEPRVIGGVYPSLQEDRLLTRLEDTPQVLIETLLQIEDQGFYQHWGISLRGISRAFLANIKAGRTVQGGSTLTQQLIKNMLLTRERSYTRKFLEVTMALLTELHYSKEQILEAYINDVYLGQDGARAIHGFALAAQHYFGRPLADLSEAQVATLVGMVKGPSYYNPWRYPERATERRNLVLNEIARMGWLEASALAEAKRSPLRLVKQTTSKGSYPGYVDLVRRQLRRDYRSEDLQTKGLRIFTPFDPMVQRAAEQSLLDTLAELGPKAEGLEAAMVVTNVKNGDVVALVGGRQVRYAGFNRALDALRPIGSLVKPAVYLSALNQPRRYNLLSLVADEPISVRNADGSFWQPRNYDRTSHGDVSLYEALAFSYNQATARLGLDIGLEEVIDTLRRLGVQRNIEPLPSLLLGAIDLSPVEVAVMYQTIAAGGEYNASRSIYAITDTKGQLLGRYPQQSRQTFNEASVHLLQYALQAVVREGTGRGVYNSLRDDYRVAGKTGTSNDLRDSWFAGFAGDYLAVVWLGKDNNASTELTGSSGALKVWRNFMARVSREPMPFVAVDNIEYHWVNTETGELSAENCADSRRLPFIAGSEPRLASRCAAFRSAPSPGRIFDWFKNILDQR